MSIAEKLNTATDNVPKVYEAGKKAEYDAVWDAIQNGGSRTNYQHAFRYEGWNDTTFKPKYNIAPSNANSMFAGCGITDLSALFETQGVTFDTSNTSDLTSAFQSAANLKKVPKIDLSNIKGENSGKAINLFNMCQKLVEIEEIVFTEGLTDARSMFGWCSALKNIKVSGTIATTTSFQNSPLTAKSLISIVAALSTSASGKSLTVKSTAVNNADWSTTEYASWDALLATRPNWTFVLF